MEKNRQKRQRKEQLGMKESRKNIQKETLVGDQRGNHG
jgi:hypothetical protein